MNNMIQSTGDVRANILAATKFLNEQRLLLEQQGKDVERQRKEKEARAKKIKNFNKEIELKGKEREKLVQEVEKLMKIRIDKDVKLVETGQDSNRYVRCIYKQNRMTLKEYLENFITSHGSQLDEEMKENPMQSLMELLRDKKILKKNFKPYQSAVTKGYFEEKPVHIYVDSKNGAVRVETEVYITVTGIERLRSKELKRFMRVR